MLVAGLTVAVPTTGRAAVFERVEPVGHFNRALDLGWPIAGTTIGTDFVKIVWANPVAGYNFEERDQTVTLGEWSRVDGLLDFITKIAEFVVGVSGIVKLGLPLDRTGGLPVGLVVRGRKAFSDALCCISDWRRQ